MKNYSIYDTIRITESYVDSIELTESIVLDNWNESKKKLRSNIIQYEKSNNFPIRSRYDWKLEDGLIEKLGITDENGYEFVGDGAGRIVYSTPFGTVLKIASDSGGISQNIEEFENKVSKNNLGCFPMLIWKSIKGFAIETEMVYSYGYENKRDFMNDFKMLNGIDFSKYSYSVRCFVDGDYDSEETVDDVGINPSFIINKVNNPSNESQRILKILTNYLLKRDDGAFASEILRHDNWGRTIRNGSDVLIPLDVGGSGRIMRKYYYYH